jgi:hypothetical protein
MLNIDNFEISNINFEEKYIEVNKDGESFKIFKNEFSNENDFISNLKNALNSRIFSKNRNNIFDFFNHFKESNIEYFFKENSEEVNNNLEGLKADIIIKIIGFKNDNKTVIIKPISSLFKKEESFYPVLDFDLDDLLNSDNYKRDLLIRVEQYLVKFLSLEKNNEILNFVN